MERQRESGWGSKVIDQLAKDLAKAFPEIRGFSSRNLKYMQTFAEAYPDEEVVQRSVAQLPWRHNIALLEKLKDPDERLWYAEQAIENGWNRDVLFYKLRRTCAIGLVAQLPTSNGYFPKRNLILFRTYSKTPII